MKKKSKSGLITITPKKRTKGFLSSNISLSDFNHTDIKYLYERLINIKRFVFNLISFYFINIFYIYNLIFGFLKNLKGEIKK